MIPVEAELVTPQAADLPSDFRPLLVTRLEKGKNPFTKTGCQRRIRAASSAK